MGNYVRIQRVNAECGDPTYETVKVARPAKNKYSKDHSNCDHRQLGVEENLFCVIAGKKPSIGQKPTIQSIRLHFIPLLTA